MWSRRRMMSQAAVSQVAAATLLERWYFLSSQILSALQMSENLTVFSIYVKVKFCWPDAGLRWILLDNISESDAEILDVISIFGFSWKKKTNNLFLTLLHLVYFRLCPYPWIYINSFFTCYKVFLWVTNQVSVVPRCITLRVPRAVEVMVDSLKKDGVYIHGIFINVTTYFLFLSSTKEEQNLCQDRSG